jgi:hypothetical protein
MADSHLPSIAYTNQQSGELSVFLLGREKSWLCVRCAPSTPPPPRHSKQTSLHALPVIKLSAEENNLKPEKSSYLDH